jgi:hypothetical protein
MVLADDGEVAHPPSFEQDILPLLAQKCHSCHGADDQQSQLDLRTLSEIMRGGENGPAVIVGDPAASLLFDLIASGQMPPDEDEKLSPNELDLISRWIKAGTLAKEKIVPLPPRSRVTQSDRDYWAFMPPQKNAVPQVQNTDRVRTTIDRFLLGKLEPKGTSFSPDAEKTELIRRAYMDLIGLPPEPRAVEAFVNDDRLKAYELMIDDLLESPHYGERWGRHWLDAAGYVDGKLDNDLGTMYPSNGIWRYRDYVIQSFNEDKPFDQFLTEQIAGDELVDWRQAETFDDRTKSLLAATGFLRNVDDHTDFDQYGIEKRYEVVNETLDMFSTAVLGLTFECCRCHNHKYDPLPQRDYYRLMACFEPALNPHAWKKPKDRYLADVSPKERAVIDQRNTEINQQVADMTKAEATLRQEVRQRVFESRLNALPEESRADIKQAIELAADKRNEAQQALASKHEAGLKISDADVEAALTDDEKGTLKSNADQRATLSAQKKSYGVIQALWDVGPPPVSHVHRRGNVKTSRRDERPSSCAGSLVDATRPSAHRASLSQSRLASSFRTRDRRDARQLRPLGKSPLSSGTARLAGGGFHRAWMEREAAASADHAVDRVPAVVAWAGSWRECIRDIRRDNRSGKSPFVADEPASSGGGDRSRLGLGRVRFARSDRGRSAG